MAILSESPDSDVAMDIGSSERQDSETVYDCVICGQSGPSTEERPTGLVVLLQASSGNYFICTYQLVYLNKLNGKNISLWFGSAYAVLLW